MRDLLRAARAAARRRLGSARVYSVSIWTDPDAAASSVSIDTRSHSADHLATLTSWAHGQVAKQPGMDRDLTEALLKLPDRNINPADFALADLVVRKHTSFPAHWASNSEGACWDVLGPALERVAQEAVQLFAELPLDLEAELGVNSAHDWYDHRRAFGEQAT